MLVTLIKWVVGFALTLAVAIFSVLNRQEFEVVWSPFHDSILLPVYAVVLGAAGSGFLLGALAVWLNTAQDRIEKRSQKKAIKALEREIDSLKEDANLPPLDNSKGIALLAHSR